MCDCERGHRRRQAAKPERYSHAEDLLTHAEGRAIIIPMMRRFWLVGLAISAVLVSSPSAPGRSSGTTWSGAWTTEWGDMRLAQYGMKVEGTYPHDAGHVVGTVSGKVFTGRWDEAPMRKGKTDAGALVLTMKADGKSFSGRSNYDGSPNSWSTEWNGTCVSGRCLTGVPTTCTKTYVIQPSGKKIVSNIKLTELSPAAIAKLQDKEKAKYEGYPYTPTGAPETRKQNCAGLVLQTLVPGDVQQGNVDPDEFFRKIVQPYGEKVRFRKKGDVVVYIDGHGVVKHVAIVESAPVLGATKILTKDGDERPYIAGFPNRFNILTNDPLFQAHAGPGGRVEFWRLDRSKVRIQEVSSGQCDLAPPAPTGQAGSFVLAPQLTEVKNPNAPELKIEATAGTADWNHTGQYGGAGNGGDWMVHYTFRVPGTLIAGKSASITLGLAASNVNPVQPNTFQISALAPDFAQALSITYPNPASLSKPYTVPISAGYKDAKEITITIGVVSAQVVYHYKRAGA
jgi:hypothetical protein